MGGRPSESIDWYTFLEGGYPWLLLTHDERRELLNQGVDPSDNAFNLSAWDSVVALTDFLSKDGVEIRRFLGSDTGTVLPGEVLDHRSPRNRLHAKAYLFSNKNRMPTQSSLQQPYPKRPLKQLGTELASMTELATAGELVPVPVGGRARL